MKYVIAATATLLLALPAFAQPAPDGQAARHAEAAAGKTAEAVGQIKSVDAAAGTVTIHHAPIAELGWPAMTMSFKASPEALQAARPGQTVRFTLATPENRVVRIQAQ